LHHTLALGELDQVAEHFDKDFGEEHIGQWLTDLNFVTRAPNRLHTQPVSARSIEDSGVGVPPSTRLGAPRSSTCLLAARTAGRATQADSKNNLLPPEYAARYHQKFVDRLWMRGLLATLALYTVFCIVYFVAVAVLGYFTGQKEDRVAALGPGYTNALQNIPFGSRCPR